MPAVAPTTSIIHELTELLAQESRLYGELLALGEEERDAIVGRDPAVLKALVARKETIVIQIAGAETERQSWIAGWAASAGQPAESVTLSDLVCQLAPADAACVAALRESLLARIRDVAEMNHRNSQLLTSALRIVGRSIDAYGRIAGAGGYEPTGERVRAMRTVVLDRRV